MDEQELELVEQELELVEQMSMTVDPSSLTWSDRESALRDVCTYWSGMVQIGWYFAGVLKAAVTQFCPNQDTLEHFLADVSDQAGVSVKRLKNILSLSRNERALMAAKYDLELGHGDALAKLENIGEAKAFARLAAEQRWTVADLRAAIRGEQDAGKPKLVVIELDPTTTDDDWAALIVKTVLEYRGEDGLLTLGKWIADRLPHNTE